MAYMGEKYSREQREALWEAALDRGIRPVRHIVELAKRGELRHGGETLDPFTIGEGYAAQLIRGERRRRAGRAKSDIAKMPHRDGVEALRTRLMSAADALLTAYEKQLDRDANKAEPKRLTEIIACTRQAAALPARDDPRPTAPGQKIPGTHTNALDGPKTLAGPIMAAARHGAGPRPDNAQQDSEDGDQTLAENGTQGQTEGEAQRNGDGDSAPGSWMREQVSG